MYNLIVLFTFVLLGGVVNLNGVGSQSVNQVTAQLHGGAWNGPSCSCPVSTSGYVIRHLLSSNWKVEINANNVPNDPNSVTILTTSASPTSYRGPDALHCPGGPSSSPLPAGSCPSAPYNYQSSPKATAWLNGVRGPNNIPFGMDDRIVITDILPVGTNPFIVRRLKFKVKRAAAIFVDLFVGGIKTDACDSDIYPNQGAWTTVRCNFCGNLNHSVDKFELRFVTASSGLGSTWNAVGIKKLKIWTCEY